MTIREYLCREAQRITDGALTDIPDAAAWARQRLERRRQFLEMMGLQDLLPDGQRTPPSVTVTGVVQRPDYRIEKLYYESRPGLYVTANLYVPDNLAAPASAVLYQCGHGPKQKVYYQAHPRRFAQLGFVCLLIETVQLGEVAGHHHGPYREGWFHWYSRGYTPAGIELFNAIRGLDLLAQRPDVDATRLGVTGTSGGGAATWWTAAADERVRAAAPSCATATLASHITDRTVDDHCDCMWWINTYGWDLADVGALIAPRPLLIASADRDSLNTIAGIRDVHAQIRPLYETLGAPENLQLVETPGQHAYHERSRTAIFSWFARHLQGRDVAPEEVGDIGAEQDESEQTLRVFVDGVPADNHTATIHDELFRPPSPPQIADEAELGQVRGNVVAALRRTTSRAFPTAPPPLDARVEMEFAEGGATGCRFTFTAEDGWRLPGRLVVPRSASDATPVVVVLRVPDEPRGVTEAWSRCLPDTWPRAVVEPRGTGETAWGQELQWHVRRAAAWTGRTLASMRVYDTLRALEAARGLPQAVGRPVALAARGEMTTVALYAALLDGQIHTVFLEEPVATQDAPSQPDGRGPAVEMLGCLRFTDLPQVAGLLYPTELVFLGDVPPAYAWAEELYGALGMPGQFRRVPMP